MAKAAVRPFYRNAVVEPVLLAAVSLQIALGLVLLYRLWRRGLRGNLVRWQFISGLVSTLFVTQHLAGMAFSRWWPASVASNWPLALYFWPYNFPGVLAFFSHAGIGLSFALRRKGQPAAARVAIKASVIMGVSLARISGQLQPVDLRQDWRDYLELISLGS